VELSIGAWGQCFASLCAVKTGIHPDYRNVVFEDASNGVRFITRSTIKTGRTTQWDDGETYPHVLVDISSSSHPYFTGQMRIVDTAGRVERFNKKYGARRAK
jgi:large subunit ribosomal protein L31